MKNLWNKMLDAVSKDGVAGWLYYGIMGGIALLNITEALIGMEITVWNYVWVNIIVLMVLGSVWTTGRCLESQKNLTECNSNLAELYRPYFERAVYGEEKNDE